MVQSNIFIKKRLIRFLSILFWVKKPFFKVFFEFIAAEEVFCSNLKGFYWIFSYFKVFAKISRFVILKGWQVFT